MIVATLLCAVGAVVIVVGGARAVRRSTTTQRFWLPWGQSRMGPSVRMVDSPWGTAFVEVLPLDPPVTLTVEDDALLARVRVPMTSMRLTELVIDDEQWRAAPVTAEVLLHKDESFVDAITALRRHGQRARLEGETLVVSTRGGHETLPHDLAPLLQPLLHSTRHFAAALERATTKLPPLDGTWREKTSTSASSGSPFVVRG